MYVYVVKPFKISVWLIVCILVLAGCCGSTPQITTPNAVALLESVVIGNQEQWVLIRGEDKNNPVLLWLHGGPGSAQMPIARHFNGDLEKDFVVVHWDQRGAGKSNPRDFDENTMSTEQFMSDTHELTQWLKAHFAQDKIFLLGHSWGSELGIQVAHQWPEDYHAFISVSQVINDAMTAEVAYAWVQEQIVLHGTQRDQRRLERLGPPPFPERDRYISLMRLVDSFGGSMDIAMPRLAWIAFQAPEYTPRDYIRWLRGTNRGSGPMWDETPPFNAYERITQLEIQFIFSVAERTTIRPGYWLKNFMNS